MYCQIYDLTLSTRVPTAPVASADKMSDLWPESPDGLPLSATEPFYTGDNMTVAWNMNSTGAINLLLVKQYEWNDSNATSVYVLRNSDASTSDWRVGSSDLNYTQTSVGPVFYWHVADPNNSLLNCSSEHFRVQNRTGSAVSVGTAPTNTTPAGTTPTGTYTGTSTGTTTSTQTDLSAGAIVGITLGSAVALLAILALFAFIFRKRLAPLLPCLSGKRRSGSERLGDDELTQINSSNSSGGGGSSSPTHGSAVTPATFTPKKRSLDSTDSNDMDQRSPIYQHQHQHQQQQQRRTVHQLPPTCLPPNCMIDRHELPSRDVPIELESNGDVEALPLNIPISLYSTGHGSMRTSTLTEYYRNHI